LVRTSEAYVSCLPPDVGDYTKMKDTDFPYNTVSATDISTEGPLMHMLITGAPANSIAGSIVFDTVIEYTQEASLKKLQ